MEVLMPITLKSSDQDRCKPHIEKVSGEEHVGLDQKGQDQSCKDVPTAPTGWC